MSIKQLFFVFLCACSPLCWSACQQHEVTKPSDVKIKGDSVMIVVHQSSTYDARFSTKRGVDEAVRFAKDRKIPVI